jgi:hypothetical protein
MRSRQQDLLLKFPRSEKAALRNCESQLGCNVIAHSRAQFWGVSGFNKISAPNCTAGIDRKNADH